MPATATAAVADVPLVHARARRVRACTSARARATRARIEPTGDHEVVAGEQHQRTRSDRARRDDLDRVGLEHGELGPPRLRHHRERRVGGCRTIDQQRRRVDHRAVEHEDPAAEPRGLGGEVRDRAIEGIDLVVAQAPATSGEREDDDRDGSHLGPLWHEASPGRSDSDSGS